MIYTIEKFEDNVELIKELSAMHYNEAAPYTDIPLNVNWEKFKALERMGYLKFYVAKEEEKVIGYAIFSVNYSLEYSLSLQATLSNIFIHPDHRGQGGAFISWCDDQLRDLGVQVVYHHVKAKNDYGKLLKRLGYEKMNIDYSKRLDKE